MNNFSRYRSGKGFHELSVEFWDRSKIFFSKAMRGAPTRRLTRADRRFLRRLVGTRDPLSALTGTDRRARYRTIRSVNRRLRELRCSDPTLDCLLVSIINADWETSDEQTHIPLGAMQALTRRFMRKISPNWLGMVELQVFSNRRHADGGKVLSSHIHLIVWGSGIEGLAHAVAFDANQRMTTSMSGCDPVVVELIRPTALDIGRVVRYMFKTPDRCKNVYTNADKGIQTINESEAGDRYIRYFRMFQLQSMLQLDRLLFASGEGGLIRAAALREVHNWRDAAVKRQKRADVMAQIAVFWAELMPRLGHARFTPPVIE